MITEHECVNFLQSILSTEEQYLEKKTYSDINFKNIQKMSLERVEHINYLLKIAQPFSKFYTLLESPSKLFDKMQSLQIHT